MVREFERFGNSPWLIRERDPAREKRLAKTISVSELTAHLLLQRGITEREEAERFLRPQWSHLPDLKLLPELDRAVERLTQALAKKEKVLLYGDYDVDGMTATAELAVFFRELGLEPETHLPHRLKEGYGLNLDVLKEILERKKPDLIVTIDNGTNASAEIDFAKQQGVDVIVIDHHETPKERPACLALLNPKRQDSRFSEPVASAGLVYLLLLAWRAELRRRGIGPLPNLRRYLDLAALGTIADVVPLTGLNRLLVKEGLAELNATQRPGLAALISRAELRRPITVGGAAFRIAPRLNAAGRLADPRLAFELLLTQDSHAAAAFADQLEGLNRERQQIEEKVLAEAIEMVESSDRRGIAVGKVGWHLGVVGIVAARLVERYGKPAFVFSINPDQGTAKGSGRTPKGFSLYEALCEIRDTMVRFGGHHDAAGATLKAESLEIFAQRFDQAVRDRFPAGPGKPMVVDALLKLAEIGPNLMKELALLKPHGPGNPEPLFAARDVFLERSRIVGLGHLKAVACQDGAEREAIGFDWGHYLPRLKDRRPHQIAFQPEWSLWNGVDRVQLVIRNLSQ